MPPDPPRCPSSFGTRVLHVYHARIPLYFYFVGKLLCQGGKPDTGKFHSSYIGMNVCSSAYENGCVVDGTCATAAD